MENKKSSRRTFIQQSVLAAAGLGLAGKVQAAGWGDPGADDGINGFGSIRPMVNSPFRRLVMPTMPGTAHR